MSIDSSNTTTNAIETIKSRFSDYLKDITESSKGDMNLYSPSKNIRIQVANKQKIIKSDYAKFDNLVEKLQPSVAVFISFNDDIPFRIKSIILNNKPVLELFINNTDINDRFIDMLSNQENIPEVEEKSLALENSKKKPKESIIETYESTDEGFELYCKNIAISKIEYEKAKVKWSENMKNFENRSKFIEHVKEVKQSEQPSCNGTKDEFYEFIRTNPLSKITKKEIKSRFGNLSNDITFMDKTGNDFKADIKKLKESLQK